MRTHKSLLVVIAASLAFCSQLLAADAPAEAEKHHADAVALLAQGDFPGAARALAAAAQADPEEPSYRQQAALVRSVVRLRTSLDRETNPERWRAAARALRAFYYEYKVFGEALALDEKVHRKINTAETAAALGETRLELGMNKPAAELLAGLDEQRTSERSRVLLGIALARLGRAEEARAIADTCAVPQEPTPMLCFDMARLQSLLGRDEAAAKLLTLAFEATPPSLLEATKERTRNRADLVALAASSEYEHVWLTASKVKESSCSTGTSCGACPSARTCGAGQKKSGK
jgi:thioredoxin-like negative regulator of GroEL